jgi:hypothetical protein
MPFRVPSLVLKRVFIVLLASYGVYGAFHPQSFSFLDGVNLLFHEGGHVLFGALGEYVGIWGGTLMQCILPLAVAVYFFKEDQRFSSAVAVFWLGQNFFHIASYVKDARSQALPLVGGEVHDWDYILSRAGWLAMDQFLGNAVWTVGLLVIFLSVYLGWISASKNRP